MQHRGNRQIAKARLFTHRDRRRFRHPAKQVQPTQMRGPEIVLIKRHIRQFHRIAGDVAGVFGQPDHIADQHIIKPRAVVAHKLVNHPAKFGRRCNSTVRRIRLNAHMADVK